MSSRDPRRNGFNYERAARALVDASFSGDEGAARKYGVSTVSIWNWRNRLNTDPKLLMLFSSKKEQAEANWSLELIPAILAAIDFLKRAAQSADPTQPDVIYSIAGALKIMADVRASMDILDARLAEFNREARAADQQMAAVEADEPNTEPVRIR